MQMNSSMTTTPSFAACLRDISMVDQDCMRLFGLLGRLRSPFQGVDDWPDLDDALAAYSAAWLKEYGEEIWETAGGEYVDGKPTCRRTSGLAVRALDKIVREHGGVKWLDMHAGKEWAVRLERATHGDPRSLYGLAISWFGGRIPLDPVTRQRFETVDEASGRRMRLYRRAEQLLWITYATVMQQHTSLILLPDIALGQALWGGDKGKWPKDWRNEILQAFSALTSLHLEKLRLSANGWKPRLCAASVAIAHAELLSLDRENANPDKCRPPCPLFGSLWAPQHHHFLVQAGYGLLGKLETFAIPAAEAGNGGFPIITETAEVQRVEHTPTRCYGDFGGEPRDEDQAQTIRDARKAGQIIPVHLPTAIFGAASWSGLQPSERAVVQALVQEVTRYKEKRTRPERPDRAYIQVGNRVPGLASTDSCLVCPYLEEDGRYVVFGGNGRRRGMGYLVFGRKGNGWLAKCQFASQKGSTQQRSAKKFLGALRRVGDMAGLVAVGLCRRTKVEPPIWLRLDELWQLAKSSKGWETLQNVHLRVYGPEDYLDRLREHYAAQGNMTGIPGAAAEAPASRDSSGDFTQRLLCCGLSQREIAKEIGCRQSFLSQCLHGKRRWPDRLKRELEQLFRRLAKATSR